MRERPHPLSPKKYQTRPVKNRARPRLLLGRGFPRFSQDVLPALEGRDLRGLGRRRHLPLDRLGDGLGERRRRVDRARGVLARPQRRRTLLLGLWCESTRSRRGRALRPTKPRRPCPRATCSPCSFHSKRRLAAVFVRSSCCAERERGRRRRCPSDRGARPAAGPTDCQQLDQPPIWARF